MSGDDAFKYFRIEARELAEALTRGGLALEHGAGGKDIIPALLRSAHTLKGAARVVGATELAELAHAIEDTLVPHREADGPLPADQIERAATLIEAAAASVRALDRSSSPQDADPAEGRSTREEEDRFETVRVELAEMDALLEGVAETAIQISAFRALLASLGESPRDAATRQQLASAADRALREISQVRTRTDRLRLLPARLIFDSLERAARDAARELQRPLSFVATGGEIRLEQPVLAALQSSFFHVIRNAIAHGIEEASERAAASKPPAGRIELRVERRQGRVTFSCADDGRGIDVDAVRRAAVSQGLLTAEAARDLGIDEATRLLRRGGLSTAGTVSAIAGRGIGLGVLGEVADRLKGQLTIQTQPGQGTTVALTVPISLSSVPALVADAADLVVAFPRSAVRTTMRIKRAQIVRGAHGDTILAGETAIPFAHLADLLGRPRAPPLAADTSCNLVLVENEGERAAIGIDGLRGLQTLVVRPLPRAAGAIALVAGASLDADGHPWLVLEPAALVRAAHTSLPSKAEGLLPVRPPILVIDDSLTTRMLERTILETAGYEVDIATSGEEGLAKAAARRYGVFVVDVEMPGIDGFEFVRRTRADPHLRATPAILVTSLGSPEHKRRGLEAGARAFIVKSQFDELLLLGTIRSLLG